MAAGTTAEGTAATGLGAMTGAWGVLAAGAEIGAVPVLGCGGGTATRAVSFFGATIGRGAFGELPEPGAIGFGATVGEEIV